jgi:hypothetical protein
MCFVILAKRIQWTDIGEEGDRAREDEEDRSENSAMAWTSQGRWRRTFPSETTLVLKMKDGME